MNSLVDKIVQYIEKRIKNEDKTLGIYERISKCAFFSINYVIFSVETREPVDKYMHYAVLDALRKVTNSRMLFLFKIRSNHSLNIWRILPPASPLVGTAKLRNIIGGATYFYDPQDIIRNSLRVLHPKYVVFAPDEASYSRAIQQYKRKYRTPLVVYLEVENVKNEIPIYTEPRSVIICKNRELMNFREQYRWNTTIPLVDDPERFVAEYGHDIALKILTGR